MGASPPRCSPKSLASHGQGARPDDHGFHPETRKAAKLISKVKSMGKKQEDLLVSAENTVAVLAEMQAGAQGGPRGRWSRSFAQSRP